VRYEKTDDEGWGPQKTIPPPSTRKTPQGRVIDGNAGAPPACSRFLTTDLLQRARQRYVERGTRAQRDYDGLYPSLNASFSVSDQIVVRAAYARTIGRPNLGSSCRAPLSPSPPWPPPPSPSPIRA
jgi:iron complex outermembrane receptor protein